MSPFNDYCIFCDQMISKSEFSSTITPSSPFSKEELLYCCDSCKLNDQQTAIPDSEKHNIHNEQNYIFQSSLHKNYNSLLSSPSTSPGATATKSSKNKVSSNKIDTTNPYYTISLTSFSDITNKSSSFLNIPDQIAENNYKLWLHKLNF
ncbi:hypothetical protein KAFR_0I00920 [Kazachstania africana CBS 2517]|uniref:Uncharacterized protein n=1 Tax=Kazachstania africana (strain ATCC 22294 / BCRC 22015 / CBS 2517 / CECT 1963 / NBRC 1671 / NRRL Y-8276) TaxID=1071382 RepID=H2AZS3_KAZAF|nr:hypothetical protein KAFR_0I00920 [Kazachstania africana CBS 2517]CCF59873.1 hypothetical protein KAFR_0I00920 [Kazachstania africana CBS 2517]